MEHEEYGTDLLEIEKQFFPHGIEEMEARSQRIDDAASQTMELKQTTVCYTREDCTCG